MKLLRLTLSLLLLGIFVCLSAAAKDKIHVVFIGNSITYGATLADPSTQAPPVITGQLLEKRTKCTVKIKNCGVSGITTYGFLPGRGAYNNAVSGGEEFSKEEGPLYFSIMLGTNDSAEKGPEGSPVDTETYKENIKKIIDALHTKFPKAKFILNYPIWYSPTTHNGATYLQAGLDRLKSYHPVIDNILDEYASSNPGMVNAGLKEAFDFFEGNNDYFTSESGNSGTFWLHPNAQGAVKLAGFWTDAIMKVLATDGIKEGGEEEDDTWVKGKDLVTDSIQISTNTMESYQFSTSNLIRPEIEGYGTGQFIYHCSWTDPLPAGEYPYLQFHLNEAVSDIFFHMISSEWSSTYDTPQDMDIYATNTPNDENSWKKIVELTDLVTVVTHPIDYYSPHINLGDSYTDLRFVAKKNVNGRASKTGSILFNLGRFQIIKAESTDTPIKKLQKLLDDISEKDPQYKAGTEPGYYSEEAIQNYSAAYEEANYVLSQELSDEEYTKAEQDLRKAYEAVEASLVKVGEGYYYFVNASAAFNSKQGVEKAMCVLSNGKLGWNTFDRKDPKFLFKVAHVGDGTFSIQSVYNNKYIGSVKGTSKNVPLTDQPQTLQTINQIGTAPQFAIANTTNDVSYYANGHNDGAGLKGEIINTAGGTDSPSAWFVFTQNDTQLIDSLAKAGKNDCLKDQATTAINSTAAVREKANDYEPYITKGSQITSNSVHGQFVTSNLIRPESDGYGTNEYIWHTSWSNPQKAGEYAWLQVSLDSPVDAFKFRMVSSEWQFTHDTPKDMEILATNTPDDEDSWQSITELNNMVTEIEHPVKYVSPVINLGGSYSNLRFLVKSTVNNRLNAVGGFFVSLGRFQVMGTTPIANSEYYVVEGMKAACDNYDNISAGLKQKLADGTLTVADINALYDAAKEIDKLYVDRDSIYGVFANLLVKAQNAYDNAVPSLQAVIVNGEQITANSTQSDQFLPSNLILPESDGYGTGQYIWHTSWSDPLPADELPYLQVHMNAPQSSFLFSMISSEWGSTYDTPEEMEILATNTPDDENSWASVKELTGIVSGSGQADAHPVRYTSPMIELGGEYSDVRFVVKKTINMRASGTGGFYVSLGRFQMYTGIDPERVQYNYNPEVKTAADELKALIEAGKTKGTHEVLPSDVTTLENAITKLLEAYADTTELSRLYNKMIKWACNMEVGEEIGMVDDEASIDDFVSAVKAARSGVSEKQPMKDDIKAAIKGINDAKAAILGHTRQIEPNKWYYIYSKSNLEYCANKAIYLDNTNAGANIRFGQYAGEDEDPAYLENPYAMWRFVPIEGTDGYSIQNLATSHSIAPTSGRGEANICRMQGGFSPFRVDYIGMGQLQFVSVNENNKEEYPLHAQERGSVIVPWATDVDGASCWGVIPVEDDAYLNFPIEANSIRVMTLPFDVPAGATSIMSLNDNLLTYSVKNITVDAEAGKTTVELTLCEDVKAGVPFIVIEGDYTQYDPENTESASLYTMLPENVDTVVREANGLIGTLDGFDITKEGYGYMRNGKLNVSTGTHVHINGMSGCLDLDKVKSQEGATDVVISVDGIINEINEINAAAAKVHVNVYTVDGTLVKKNVSPAEAVRNLSKGIYIVEKKKVLVK